MISNLWIDTRKNNWNRLETLLRQVESTGVRSLGQGELRDFGLLYRQAAADLSAVRADHSSRSLENYLNRLVGRAHNYVYVGQRVSVMNVWQFFAHGYPRMLRRLSGYVLTAALLMVVSGAIGAVMTSVRPEFGVAFFGAKRIADLDKKKMWTDEILSAKPPSSSFIMTNNISVCLYSSAGGITAGLLTLLVLLQNGFMLGVIAVICAQHHMALSLWSFVAAHGALELPAIAISGAAGLRLATGLLFPGSLSRKDSIARGGIESVQLVCGTIPMLIVAGVLEGFLSPTRAPMGVKFGVGAVLFVGLCLWLTEGGRKQVSTEQVAASS